MAVAMLVAWFLVSSHRERSALPVKSSDHRLQQAIASTPDLTGDVPAFDGLLPYSRISLERTACYGPCPVFRVEFTSDGKGTLDAKANLPTIGHFKTEIGLREFARLCQLAKLANLADLKPRYEASWTDDASYVVRVQSNNRNVEISDYGAVGPAELWALAQGLDAVRLRARWVQ